MAQAVEALWPADAPLSGVVVTRYGHVPGRPSHLPHRVEVLEAAHPVPDAASAAASVRILEVVQGLTEDDLVLCLMSGGASALLTAPVPGLSLGDKQWINRSLLMSGAPIAEMNCVRKHISRIKGGRLAAACAPAHVVTLAISDVPGDAVSAIGSGPTVGDPTTCADALEILSRYRIDTPAHLRKALESGALESPKPHDPIFERCSAEIVAAPWQSLEAAATLARSAGVPAHILSDTIEGESREVAKALGAIALSVANRASPFAAPCVLLSGGETTVTVQQDLPIQERGRGGRAGEFCLSLVQSLASHPRIWGLAADTDGIDGSEENAGAMVTPRTLALAAAKELDVHDHLFRNDSHAFFGGVGGLVVTGPTYTNVNDFRALLIM